MTEAVEEFEAYLEHLAQGLGHADRHAGLKGYCAGLVMPLTRKSVEPMAARLDPLHASARHQSLHHFVAKAQWSDAAVEERGGGGGRPGRGWASGQGGRVLRGDRGYGGPHEGRR